LKEAETIRRTLSLPIGANVSSNKEGIVKIGDGSLYLIDLQ